VPKAKNPAFDAATAHMYFAAHCFNRAWDLIEEKDRTAEDDRLMVALNQASIYHWLQRPDCGNQQLSVGFWQASRIQSLLGNAAEARRQAEVCLSYSGELSPFYLGYAHEALARAAKIAGDKDLTRSHKEQAKTLAGTIKGKDEQDLLLKDLDSI
jgi:hypothetical protein